MTTYYRAVAISEDVDPDHHVDDCVWCSGLRQANANSGGKHPPTLAEAEALEAAAGGPFVEGSNSKELAAGLAKRYGLGVTIATTPATIIAAAKPGQNLTVSGHLSNLPPNHRLRRYSPTFTGGHRISVDVEDGPRYWWVDPLAPPNTGPTAGYVGEYVTLAELTTFAKNGSGGTVAPLHVIPSDPSAYLHTIKVAPAASLGLNVHATPHQAAKVLVHMPANSKAFTSQLLVHGEAYAVGTVTHTDWLRVTFTGKVGWIKRGWTALVS